MKTKFVLALILTFTVSLMAQQPRPRHGLEQFDPQQMLSHLSEDLELTDEQIQQIEPIIIKTQVKLNDLKTKNYDDDREMMEEHRAVMEENAELIEEYLSEEQIETFREMRAQRPRFNKGERPRTGQNRK